MSIPAGVPSLDPANADTSEAETLTIDLRGIATPPRWIPREWYLFSVCVRVANWSSVLSKKKRVTGAFDVRFVLTEKHPNLKDNMTVVDIKKYIKVENGEPSNLRVGVPFSRIGPSTTTT